MVYKLPDDMEKLVYFSRRIINGKLVIAWANKKKCPKCGKALMGKPKDPKTGKIKIRSKEIICPACGYTLPKDEYESGIEVIADYDCPHCGKHGQSTAPYKWKTRMGVKTIRFTCEHCGKNIDITKKMKEPKSSKN